MKRYLDKQRYELSDLEKKDIWRRINGSAAESPRWSMRPVLGLTAVAAALAVCLFVWQNGRLVEKIMPPTPAGLMGSTDHSSGGTSRIVTNQAAGESPADPATTPPGPVEVGLADGAAVHPDPLVLDAREQSDVASRTEADAEDRSRAAGAGTRNQAPPESGGTVDAKTVEKYAIEPVQQDLAEQSGVVGRGGRKDEVNLDTDVAAAAPTRRLAESESRMAAVPVETPAAGSVTGGTTAPNGEPYELMYFDHTGVNPFVATEDDALSTFAIDVDNASWTLARNYLERGHLPPPDAIRVEEFVNSFEAGWPEQSEQPLVIHADGAPSRFGSGYHLLRVGLAGQEIDATERKPANLVFVVDISGSMRQENRLGAVRHALTILLDELAEGDRVGIVVYGSRGEVRLQPTDISQREVIQAAIDGLVPAGSTNCYEGLKLAYDMARSSYEAGVLNRLILCSDGVANTGASTEGEELLKLVRGATDEGITLSTVGFGMGNYNDVFMEKLANKGDGNYAYVDRKEEAERVFRENLTGMLQTVARETKVQVEFNPDRVDRWRLLGYENRDIADRDFRNDDVDAGEVGVGHRVTALYEIKLNGEDTEGSLGTVRLRWEAPAHDTARAGQVTEISREISADDLAGDFGEADRRLRVQAVVAEFAEILRESYWAKESALVDLVPVADGLASELSGDAQVQELARLIRLAASIEEE